MEAVLNEYTIQVPTVDVTFFRSFIKKMGWTARKTRVSGIEKGLEDIRKGRIYHAKDSDDLIRQILG
ncbi:MAG: hypothetical protein IJ064_07310 [Bacteroidaceae bacterium]|nr:hypothetical protein [Bacteroidaceae bacterium]